MPPVPPQLSPAALRAVARRTFVLGTPLTRLLQHHRPSICPFGPLLARVPEQARVLDIGCGGGLLLSLIAATRNPRALVGFDASARAIGLALDNLPNFPEPRPQFLRLDVGDPWPEGPFDAVTICDVVHHIPVGAQAALIRRAAAAVAPGGVLIYKDVYPEGLIRPNASRLHDLLIARERIHIPRLADITREAEAAGLRLEHHERINVLWYGHELALFRRGK